MSSVGITCSTGPSCSTPSMASMRSWTTAVPIRRGFSESVVMGGSVAAYTVDSLQQTSSRSSGTRRP